MMVNEGPVTVNGVGYTADEIATAIADEQMIIGYESKSGDEKSFLTEKETDIVHAAFIRFPEDFLRRAGVCKTPILVVEPNLTPPTA